MISVPGPRVHPTTTPAGPRRPGWELRLSFSQFLVLSGLFSGAMISSYYLGFASGKGVGIEAALDGSLSSLAKLPIVPPLSTDISEAGNGNDVLAKLDSERLPSSGGGIALKKDLEGLAPIQEVRLEPLSDDRKEGLTTAEADKAKSAGAQSGKASGEAKPQDALDKALEDRASALGTPVGASVELVKGGVSAEKLGIELKRSGAIPKGWYVQAAAATTTDDARAVAERLHSSGFPVVIEDVQVGKKQYYRVLVGPEAERAPAKRMVEQVKREKFVKGEPFLRNVN